jgi:hypothetical protein
MGSIGKGFALILILIMALSSLSLLMVESANAQTIPSPSVPHFSVTQIDRSYDVPIKYTTTTDPFTGKQVTTSSGGYHVTNMTIDVIIRNQQFSPIDLKNGTVIYLYYSVRAKGHFADWTPVASSGYFLKQVLQSTSDNTVVTLIRGSENDILMGYANAYIPNNAQEDFQVSAQTGYLVPDYGGHIIPMPLGYDFVSFGDSGWSNIQTITLAQTSTSTSPSPNPITIPTQNTNQTSAPPTPTVPEFLSWTTTLFLLITMAVAAGLLVYHKKQKQGKLGSYA